VPSSIPEEQQTYNLCQINLLQHGICQDRQGTKVHSCKNCRSGKAISITYSENVFVALGIKYAKFMRCKYVYCHL